MIIYGTSMVGKKRKVSGWGRCEHCGKTAKLRSYRARPWGHLYFIPLIPAGKRKAILRECSQCKRGLHMEEPNADQLAAALRADVEKYLAALLAGHDKVMMENGEVVCLDGLMDSVDLLHHLDEGHQLDLVLAALRAKNHPRVAALMEAVWMESRGQTEEALLAYAAETRSTDAPTLAWLRHAFLAHDLKRYPEALESATEASHRLGNPPGLLGLFISLHEAMGEDGPLVEAVERLFGESPQAECDPKTAKAYKKACKRLGRSPVDFKT